MLVLVAALVLFPFPQFVSGTAAYATFSVVYAAAWARRPTTRVIFGPFLPLVVLMFASITWSEHPRTAFFEVCMTAVTIAGGLAVGLRLSLDVVLKTLIRATVLIGLVSMALGSLFPNIGRLQGPAYEGALIGFYIHKNPLAAVMMFGVLAALFREYPPGKALRSRIGPLALYGLVLSMTESATVDALVFVTLVVWVVYNWWLRVGTGTRATGLIFASVPIGVAIVHAQRVFADSLDALGRDTTLTGRTDIWAAAVSAWEEKPVLGVGWGSFATDSTVSAYQLLYYGWVRIHAHSGYVQVLTELGLIGMSLLGLTLVVTLRSTLRVIRLRPTLSSGWPLAALLAVSSHNVVEQSMKGLPLFMLALIYGCCSRQVGDSGQLGCSAERTGLLQVEFTQRPTRARRPGYYPERGDAIGTSRTCPRRSFAHSRTSGPGSPRMIGRRLEPKGLARHSSRGRE